MNPYKFTVSLRLWHPSRDLTRAASVLGVKPTRAWNKEDPRQTPTGTALPGRYPDSYWVASLTPKQISSRREGFEPFLTRTFARFAAHRQFLMGLRKSGGRAELFVGLFGRENFGVELEPGLLREAAKAGLGLSFDVYP